MYDDTTTWLSNTTGLVLTAWWHPLPVLGSFIVGLAGFLAVPAGYGFSWFVALIATTVTATTVRLRNRRLLANHRRLGPAFLSALEWQQRLASALTSARELGPETTADLRERIDKLVDKAEDLAETVQRLTDTPGLADLGSRLKQTTNHAQQAKDQAARRQYSQAACIQRGTEAAIRRAREVRERAQAQLVHIEATLESLYVQLLAAKGPGDGASMTRELDGLLGDARCLELPDGAERAATVADATNRKKASAETTGEQKSLAPAELFALLLRMARSDGQVSNGEKMLLLSTARLLGLKPQQCEEVQRRVMAEERTA